MAEDLTCFICGPPKDHKCDDEGPFVYGGDNVPTVTDRSKAGKGYSWGSVTCSVCGTSAIDRSVWEDA